MGEVPEKRALHADPIIWTSEASVWVDQWSLSEEKIQASQQLVQEQVDSVHIVPWNSPIFLIKKKSGKWRLMQDVRGVNGTM